MITLYLGQTIIYRHLKWGTFYTMRYASRYGPTAYREWELSPWQLKD